jgi:hypothetical protein
MKPTVLVPLLTALLASTAFAAPPGAGGGFGGSPGAGGGFGNPSRVGTCNTAVVAAPTADEVVYLSWLREEEKLARDVYLGLFEKWKAPEFSNIARSEQRHFDAIGTNIALLGQTDPALAAVGQFANPDIQALYYSLLESGSLSYGDALRAGATIEDIDIRDLLDAIDATSNPALLRTYSGMLEASKNHLRAFVARLATLGIDYQPQYMDPVLYDAVVGQN